MNALKSLLEDLAQDVAQLQNAVNVAIERAPAKSDNLENIWQDTPNIKYARRSFLSSSLQVQDLLCSPLDRQQLLWESYIQLTCLRVVSEHDVTLHVPVSGSISYVNLALDVKLPENVLARVLRYLATYGFFCEPSPRCVAHTPQSKALLDKTAANAFGAIIEGFHLGLVELSPALRQFGASQEPNETAFNRANITTLRFQCSNSSIMMDVAIDSSPSS